MAEPNLMVDLFTEAAHVLTSIRPLIPTYTLLVLSALFPIYAGSYASLTRPSSAAKPVKRRRSIVTNDKDARDDNDEDEEEDKVQRMEALSPSDALLFPLLAGCMLALLYFLIKWLENLDLLNKLLNCYFALFGALAIAKLIADALAWATSIVFPSEYVDNGALWQVKSKDRRVVAVSGRTNSSDTRSSPLPGPWCQALPLGSRAINALWRLREMSRLKWTIQCYVQRLVKLKTHIGVYGVIGGVVSTVAVLYYNLIAKPWWLTNLMGLGFSYAALRITSANTFSTGALILTMLFFYDIYFVFYTPMMMTVAKSLDIPIKLLFPRPLSAEFDGKPAYALLGLGDIVIPGLMIGLALRFDLFMHYVKRQKRIPSIEDDASSPRRPSIDWTDPPDNAGSDVKQSAGDDDDSTVVKAPYQSLSGRWGDVFWTHSLLRGRSLLPTQSTPYDHDYLFSKPYFTAALTGYTVGLIATLIVMHTFKHGQPALLYLVPGVLLSLVFTGLARGELKQMRDFSDAVEDEEKSTNDEGKDGECGGKKEESKTHKRHLDGKAKSTKEEEGYCEKIDVGAHKERVLVSLSISKRDSALKDTPAASAAEEEDALRRNPRLKVGDGEPPFKIRRMS